MSAIPKQALSPSESNKFQALAIERTDDSLLSDKEVYNLKGGDSVFFLKLGVGLSAVFLYLTVFGKLKEVKALKIQGTTFFWSNVTLLSSMGLTQSFFMKYTNREARYKLHQTALFSRFIENMNEVNLNRKKPKIH